MFKRKDKHKKDLSLEIIKLDQSSPEPHVQFDIFDDRRSIQKNSIDKKFDRRQAKFYYDIPWWLSTGYSKQVLLTVDSMKDIKVKRKATTDC